MKKTVYILFLFFICFAFPTDALASKATCKYKSSNKTITLTYEYGKKLKFTDADNLKLNKTDLGNKDMVDSKGNLICPKVKISITTYAKGKWKYDIYKNGDVTGTLEILKEDNLEKNEASGKENDGYSNTTCYYHEGTVYEYSLSLVGGKLVATPEAKNIKNYTFTIKNCDDAKMFEGGKCPEVYDQAVAKAKNIIIDCKNKIFSDNDVKDDADSIGDVNDSPTDKPSENYDIISFLNNSVGATKECKNDDQTCLDKQKALFELGKKAYEDCKDVFSDVKITSGDEVYKQCEKVEEKIKDYAEQGYFGNNIIKVDDAGCKATLGSLAGWLKKIYNILLLAIPVLIMVFGFKDFMRAILNGKEDELKKAGSTFIKRLIFGAVFVALPMLISLIIDLAFGAGSADICIF